MFVFCGRRRAGRAAERQRSGGAHMTKTFYSAPTTPLAHPPTRPGRYSATRSKPSDEKVNHYGWKFSCWAPEKPPSMCCYPPCSIGLSLFPKIGIESLQIHRYLPIDSVFTVGEAVRSTCGKSHDDDDEKKNRFHLSLLQTIL